MLLTVWDVRADWGAIVVLQRNPHAADDPKVTRVAFVWLLREKAGPGEGLNAKAQKDSAGCSPEIREGR